MTQVHPEHSPDESVHGAPHGNVNVNRVTVSKDTKMLILGTLLALSIVVNLWCGWIIRDVGTRKWLHDWDLNQFQMGPFATLQKDVEVTKLLVAARCDKPKEK